MRIRLVQGDTLPPAEYDTGSLIPAGSTALFEMSPAVETGLTQPVISGAADIDGSVLRYRWKPGDTALALVYRAEFHLNTLAGAQSFPLDDTLTIVVDRRVGITFSGDTNIRMIGSHRETVGATPVLIAQNTTAPSPTAQGQDDWSNISVAVKNLTQTANILIDGAEATFDAAQAFPWAYNDGLLTITLEPGEELWGQSDGADQDLAVLEQGR